MFRIAVSFWEEMPQLLKYLTNLDMKMIQFSYSISQYLFSSNNVLTQQKTTLSTISLRIILATNITTFRPPSRSTNSSRCLQICSNSKWVSLTRKIKNSSSWLSSNRTMEWGCNRGIVGQLCQVKVKTTHLEAVMAHNLKYFQITRINRDQLQTISSTWIISSLLYPIKTLFCSHSTIYIPFKIFPWLRASRIRLSARIKWWWITTW